MSTEKRLSFGVIAALAIGGLMVMWAILFGAALRDEMACKKARQAYFDAGYHAALTRDEKLIALLDDYRATYKAACRD